MKNLQTLVVSTMLLLLATTISSCHTIAGIFNAGINFGFFLVVVVIAIIVFIVINATVSKK